MATMKGVVLLGLAIRLSLWQASPRGGHQHQWSRAYIRKAV